MAASKKRDQKDESGGARKKKQKKAANEGGGDIMKSGDENIVTVNYKDSDRSFESLKDEVNLDERILQGLQSKKILAPTPLQRAAIPIIQEGHDCVIKSPTGTGKSLAFGIPLLSLILRTHDWNEKLPTWRHQIKALILTPSKELAAQLSDVLTSVSLKCHGVVGVWCLNEAPQKLGPSFKVPTLANVLVTYPGAIYKLCQLSLASLPKTDAVFFPNLRMLVLDEADLTLSTFGYKDETSELFRPTASKWRGRNISIIPLGTSSSHRAQVIMASATLSSEIEDLRKLALYEPTVVILTNQSEELSLDHIAVKDAHKVVRVVVPNDDHLARAQIREFYVPLIRKTSDDFLTLLGILDNKWLAYKTIIFTEINHRAYQIYLFLKRFGYRVCLASPTQTLETRLARIQEFNQGLHDILVACDLPNEALDIETVEDKAEVSVEELKLAAKKSRKKLSHSDRTASISRGLDFRGVCSVINFDLPQNHDIYTHRIGRAAREFYSSGVIGTSVTFVDQEDQTKINELEENGVKKPESLSIQGFLGLRYRCEDVLHSLTPKAIKDCQLAQLSQELLERKKDLTEADRIALRLVGQNPRRVHMKRRKTS